MRCFLGSLERVSKFMAEVACFLIIGITVFVTADVFLRFFFNRPQAWVAEISAYFLVGCAFLGTAHTLQVDRHITIELLSSRLSRRRQVALSLVTSVLGFIYCAVLTWQSALIAWTSLKQGWTAGGTTGFPEAPARMIIPIGSLLLCLSLIAKFGSGLRELTTTKQTLE